MRFIVIRHDEYKVTGWSGGTTSELFIYPAGSDCALRNFDFRVSSATVDAEESAFSDFTGYVRHITPIRGVMRLSHGTRDSGEAELSPGRAYTFDGGARTLSRGVCADFNLIHRAGSDGEILPLMGGSLELTASRGCLGCFSVSGGLSVEVRYHSGSDIVRQNEVLGARDTLIFLAPGGAPGEGEIILRAKRSGGPRGGLGAVLFRTSACGL
ncbi:MAG: HutD family protein [Synergistaceae bacterium]|jgi:hypothetical protein|nr:HutD family protein [Synergistaceae bacterium]